MEGPQLCVWEAHQGERSDYEEHVAKDRWWGWFCPPLLRQEVGLEALPSSSPMAPVAVAGQSPDCAVPWRGAASVCACTPCVAQGR